MFFKILKIGVFKNFVIFTENTFAGFFKKELHQHRCFPVNVAKLRTAFYRPSKVAASSPLHL